MEQKDIPNEQLFTMWEPKTCNRFVCKFVDSTGAFIPAYLIRGCDRPKFEVVINDTTGERSYKWLPIEFEMYDPIIPSAAQAMYSHIERKEPFDITIDVIGPIGDTVERWEIHKANVIAADFGSMDWTCEPKRSEINHLNIKTFYNGSDPLTIKIKVAYEYATLIF